MNLTPHTERYINDVLNDVDLNTVLQLDPRQEHIQNCCEVCQSGVFVPIRPTPDAIAQGVLFGYAVVGYPCHCVRWLAYPWDQIGHPEIAAAGQNQRWMKAGKGWRRTRHSPVLVEERGGENEE
jgi:hypothetical protein